MGNSRLSLHSQLAAFVQGKPVTATPEVPLREIVSAMAEKRVGSVVIVEPESGRPMGIFTLRDLLIRVVAREVDLDTMVASVMSSSELQVLSWRATAYQAEMLMARHGIHHVIVVDASGHLAGVVSQTDIMDLQRGGMSAISTAIRNARDVDALVVAADDIRRVARQMMTEGAAAEQLTQTISTLNDHLVVRILELTRHEYDLPRVEWCWLAFGSEGRFEQTLSTDQDNGIIFSDHGAGIEETRAAFLAFAQEVNRRLDRCGFPLCKGNIMAGNPELCLTVEEWKGRFVQWMRGGDPVATLNATIFFDFRAIYGTEELAEELQSWLLKSIPSETMFQRFMADNAVKANPPLGVIRDFVFDDNKAFPHTLELKAFGSRPFVDAARILALSSGVRETSTAERLRALQRNGKLGGEDVDAMIEGFYFIQQLRLRHQKEGTQPGAENRVNPDDLNELDRAVLKIAFKQAKKLQEKLHMEYRV